MAPTRGDCGAGRRAFAVGEWLFEPDLDLITRGDERRSLRPRVTELLLCLAERPGELAPRTRLIDAVWPTGFVTVNALTHLVSELRTALGDDAQNPAYIETIPRRGYRLIAPVSRVGRVPTTRAGGSFICKVVDDEGAEFELGPGENLIGRAPDAAVRIDTSEVSRRHARIVIEGTTATLEDLGSKNGTYLRGARLVEPTRLEDADEIQIGANLARFRFAIVDERTKTEELA